MNASRPSSETSGLPELPWVARLCHVCDRLESQPEHLLAWQWRVEKRVLMFVIMRYGDGPPLAWHFHARRMPPVLSLPGEPFYPRPPRTRAQIRRIVRRIARVNREIERQRRLGARW